MAFFIGVPMGLAYPYPIHTKICDISIIIAAIIMIYIGVKKRGKCYGRVFFIIGIILWIFMGVLGLGTGT